MQRGFSVSSSRIAVLVLSTLVALGGCGAPVPAAPASYPVDVRGAVDRIDANSVMAGWAFSKAAGATPIDVAIYAEGDNRTGTRLGMVRADQPRADVNQAMHIPGDHGFVFPIPAALKDGAKHSLHAYGISAQREVELGGSPISFTLRPPCATAGPLVAPTDQEWVVTLQADNGKFVVAECGGDEVGDVHADRAAAAEWET